ncbi:MAG: RsmD family RNA methyltransferase, partial [Woeseiaceae bacterium]
GTGALGLEALSRGAKCAVFVENSPRAVAALQANIKALAADGADVQNMEAQQYLKRPQAEKFDLVFLDPPFAEDLIDESCRLLEESNALADTCLIYIELPRSRSELVLPDTWQRLKNKTAGNVRYMLVQRKA